MARAGVASASLRSDSIKGLAQSVAKPAYRRLLTAEPLLRRAVPILIVAFMLTICIGAAAQVLDHRRQAVSDATQAIEALADHLAAELDRPTREGPLHIVRSSGAIEKALPTWAAGAGRSILVADAGGTIIAATPDAPQMLGRSLPEV
ncbi:MAG: PAS domain-containing sensor histidine kinase, partial [Xanthobacteraceae bacterium]